MYNQVEMCVRIHFLGYLGHMIEHAWLHPLETEIEDILLKEKAPTPTNLSELKSFIGLVNHYCHFLPNHSTRLAPFFPNATEGSLGMDPGARFHVSESQTTPPVINCVGSLQ